MASITIYDTDAIFPAVVALLAGVKPDSNSIGGPDARVAQSAAGDTPAAIPPAFLPPADTADRPAQRGPAARSGNRPATVGPGKAKGGTILLLAEPAATPLTASPASGMDSAPAASGEDVQRGTVGLDDAANVAETASSIPLPSDSAADTAPDGIPGRTGAAESEEFLAAKAAASPVVAKAVSLLGGTIERVEPAPKRPVTRGARSSSASKDAPASPDGWVISESAMEAAGF